MVKITSDIIRRVEAAIGSDVPVENVVAMLASEGITGYDAFLAYKAGEVSLRMWQRVYVEQGA